jgi:hypothetical protein
VRHREGSAGIDFQGLNDASTARLDNFIELVRRRRERRDPADERIRLDMAIRCLVHEATVNCRIVDVSSSGALLRFDGDDAPAVGTAVTLDLPEIGTIDARMVRRYEGGMGARFEYFEETVRDRLIQRIFTKGMNNASVTGSPAEIAKALFMRAFG